MTNFRWQKLYNFSVIDQKNMGKAENADYQHFLPSQNVLKRLLSQGH